MAIPFLRRKAPSTAVTLTSPPSEPSKIADPAAIEEASVVAEVVLPDRPKLCREKARAMVHKYAAFGTAWAVLPVPMATSAGLTALETHMLYWIARVYGEEPHKGDLLMAAGGLELCSVALKTVAVEGALFIPVVGWGVKAAVAGSAIEAIGNAAILHFEAKYPNKAA